MKVVLDIKEDAKAEALIEMIEKLDHVDIMIKVKDKKTSQFISDLAESFENIREYDKGTKKLKSAKELLNEL